MVVNRAVPRYNHSRFKINESVQEEQPMHIDSFGEIAWLAPWQPLLRLDLWSSYRRRSLSVILCISHRRLLWLQRYIVREVYRAFTTLGGLPEEESRQIEDLVDLGRLNVAIGGLMSSQEAPEGRQGAIETSQDQARQAWHDLRAEIRSIASRVAVVEQRVGGVISREQRGYPYQLMQAWAPPRLRANRV